MYNALIAKLRNRAKRLAGNQSGFTLLELLVVVAILAAIAGTAVVALQDTDARASAAAHVAMMDELDKGIREFRVLNKNRYPDRFDSIMDGGAGSTVGDTGAVQVSTAVHDALGTLTLSTITSAGEAAAGDTVVERLSDIGITTLRVTYPTTGNAGHDPDGSGDCDNLAALVADRGNAVVAGNIFLSPAANGCGGDHPIGNATTVLAWGGGTERITGQQVTNDIALSGAALDISTADNGLPVMMAVGLGPSSTLFDKTQLGGMTSVPVYRHVQSNEYNRFTALFRIGTTDGAGGATAVDQVLLVAIVDGAGDTKEEELGEWDGTRNTI
ncbi:MAG: prepilin-type N-terminal cleavage/methylation domain-containing protein [Nitrospina sp.]|nr:prepilin-type N-terminal cleavage/methylation domain-containing protein [Nitrospina sp.]